MGIFTDRILFPTDYFSGKSYNPIIRARMQEKCFFEHKKCPKRARSYEKASLRAQKALNSCPDTRKMLLRAQKVPKTCPFIRKSKSSGTKNTQFVLRHKNFVWH